MLASSIKKPFDDPYWLFEVKWDGYRAIAELESGKIALYTRNLLSLNDKYPRVIESLEKLKFEAVLDGEIVVVDLKGQPNFQMMQNYRKSGQGHLVYYAFDLLFLEGHDLTTLPLERRKDLLKKILPADKHVKFSDHVKKEGFLFFQAVQDKGLEGIIAKHSQSPYRMGTRSRQWLKIKTRLTQEGVIAGYTAPKGSRKYFGSLVLGAYEGDEFVFIGHSGGGFTEAALKDIYEKLQPLIQKECPFKINPEPGAEITWVRPQLVCEGTFTGWTEEGAMRHPIFSRLREDKSAGEVVRDTPEEI